LLASQVNRKEIETLKLTLVTKPALKTTKPQNPTNVSQTCKHRLFVAGEQFFLGTYGKTTPSVTPPLHKKKHTPT
jgi:hypothetical protein